MKRLLFVGDGCVSSGFARATHAYLDALRPTWELVLLAMHFDGSPHPAQQQYLIYPTGAGDPFGVDRVKPLLEHFAPDVLVVMNDPWNIRAYLAVAGNTPVVAICPVDGLNCRGAELNGCAHVIFWTQYGRVQACRGGYAGPASVLPLGVDRTVYQPGDRAAARAAFRLGAVTTARGVPDPFIVGACGRNQQRKRLDLTLQYFAEWIHGGDGRHPPIDDAFLWLHVAPTGDDAYDLYQLAAYFGIAHRLLYDDTLPLRNGLSEPQLAMVYQAWDVLLSTTQGEGWGLPALEAMACGVPCLLPDWAAYGDWARGAAQLVPCTSTAVTPARINVIGGVPDRVATIEALDAVYRSAPMRTALQQAGLDRAAHREFEWPTIGRHLDAILTAVATQRPAPITRARVDVPGVTVREPVMEGVGDGRG